MCQINIERELKNKRKKVKILVSCFKCTIENPEDFHFNGFLTLDEEGFYHFTCPKGHLNFKIIQAFKFELLFESGLYAIKDHFYLESVLSLTASLERFYEFAIRILLRSNGLSKDDYENLYKVISKQSERQLGAFVCLYGNAFKEAPKMIGRKHVEFRNKVVHNGYLPNEKEVLDYAEEIYETIKSSYITLLEKHGNMISDYYLETVMEREERNKEKIEFSKKNITTVAPCIAITHTLNIEIFKNQKFHSCFDYVMKNVFYA